MPPRFFGQDGIKLIGVEIEKIDMMARIGQRSQRLGPDPSVKAFG
jgi:hypothetical protein